MARILIIEDEPINREFLRLALREHGECLAVGTGEEGLRAFRRALAESLRFELVILDIKLPGMDGLKTLELLRAAEEASEVPALNRAHVVITTVFDDDQAAARAFMQGQADAYLIKPFVAARMLEELAKLGLIQA